MRLLRLPTHRIEDPVDIKCRVDNQSRIEYLVPEITPSCCASRATRQRQEAFGRESDEFFHVVCVSTGYRLVIQMRQERLTGRGLQMDIHSL